jgi:hypothetical protein
MQHPYGAAHFRLQFGGPVSSRVSHLRYGGPALSRVTRCSCERQCSRIQNRIPHVSTLHSRDTRAHAHTHTHARARAHAHTRARVHRRGGAGGRAERERERVCIQVCKCARLCARLLACGFALIHRKSCRTNSCWGTVVESYEPLPCLACALSRVILPHG